MDGTASVNGKEYRIIKLIGHGKGGYVYLASFDGRPVALKQIHHEPCDYFSFGDKLESERRDYFRLRDAGIRVPEMIDIDAASERIVKEYVEGPTVFDLVRDGVSVEPYVAEVREMAALSKAAGFNIDYFPTNFIPKDGVLYYVDYECSEYSDEWNFENWGIRYWSYTREFEEYLKSHK